MNEQAALARAIEFMVSKGALLLEPDEEVPEGEMRQMVGDAHLDGGEWVVHFIPVDPPGTVSTAHIVFVYVNPTDGKCRFLGGDE